MKTMTFTEFKRHFSIVVNSGETIAITYGRKREIVCFFNPQVPAVPQRQLELLEEKLK
jgi:hypothetical protein